MLGMPNNGLWKKIIPPPPISDFSCKPGTLFRCVEKSIFPVHGSKYPQSWLILQLEYMIHLHRNANVTKFGFSLFLSGKGKRLKQAKEEAIAEIDHYRLQREKDFRQKQTSVRKTIANWFILLLENYLSLVQK